MDKYCKKCGQRLIFIQDVGSNPDSGMGRMWMMYCNFVNCIDFRIVRIINEWE